MKCSVLALFLVLTLPTHAQAQASATRRTATVLAIAPVYVTAPPPAGLGPLRTAAVGTVFFVIGEKEDWLQVEFNDPQFGRRVGWVEKKLVRIDDPALKPMDLSVSPTPPSRPAEPTAPAPSAAAQAIRQGFTVLVNLGFGSQYDARLARSAGGLAGLNLGIGGFVSRDLAVMFRFSGTNVNYGFGVFSVNQVSGVAGPAIQYWASDRVNVEAGVGLGFWQVSAFEERDQGLGIILGVNGVVFSNGQHGLQVGFEYAPAFTGSAAVHNFGLTFGYQYHR